MEVRVLGVPGGQLGQPLRDLERLVVDLLVFCNRLVISVARAEIQNAHHRAIGGVTVVRTDLNSAALVALGPS